jgi:hypothetical protein
MGLFLHLSFILSSSKSKTVKSLKTLLKGDSYKLEEASEQSNSNELCIVESSNRNSTILFPSLFNHWELSQELSYKLKTAVLTLEIHDGNFWFFILYDNGNEILKFNPFPDYYDKNVKKEELSPWLPNVETLCKYFPNTKREEIENYFIHWTSNIIKHYTDSSDVKKAYLTDNYGYGNGLQMFDFIKKIGITYPIADNGNVSGTLFRLYKDIDPYFAALAINFEETRKILRSSKRYNLGFAEIIEKELEYLTGFNYKTYIEYFSNTFYCPNCKERRSVQNPASRLDCEVFSAVVYSSCEKCQNEISQGIQLNDLEKLRTVFE